MSAKLAEHACVVGLAWGDEGKGKVVDLLCGGYDVVVRYNGGANAGHTVCRDGEEFALHLVPSGLLREEVEGVIGAGVVVDPAVLVEEMRALEERGVSVARRLKISARAHVVMPYHRMEDRLGESAAGTEGRIGTTGRGIGPCYADKMRRLGAVRMADLLNLAACEERIREVVERKRRVFQALYDGGEDLVFAEVWEQLQRVAGELGAMIVDASTWLMDQADAGRRLFFEGANGMLLDVDHGTYPYVTSSNTGPQGIASGAGVPPALVTRRIGVTKAYTTRVGGGPFPTELCGKTGTRIRERGREYGTTTGRARRCGWLDAVGVRGSVRQGGISELAVMHLDTLSGFEQVGICSSYRLGERTVDALPACLDDLERIEPVVEMLAGWSGDLRGVRRYEELPGEARRFLVRVEEIVGAPVTIISVGPERPQTIIRG